jgi:hypothetical protein
MEPLARVDSPRRLIPRELHLPARVSYGSGVLYNQGPTFIPVKKPGYRVGLLFFGFRRGSLPSDGTEPVPGELGTRGISVNRELDADAKVSPLLGRFNGWTRIGIVLSVAWALVVLV